jgi:hypothetical protein
MKASETNLGKIAERTAQYLQNLNYLGKGNAPRACPVMLN